MIEVEIEGRDTILEFPDGTDPAVIQRAVRNELGLSTGQQNTGRSNPDIGADRVGAAPVQNQDFRTQAAGAINAVAEPALTVASSIAAEPVSGLAGIAQGLNPFAGEGASERAVRATQEALTFTPRTPEGRQGLSNLASFVEPVANALEGSQRFLGDNTFESTGNPALSALAATVPVATLEALGVKGIQSANRIGKASAKQRAATDRRVASDEPDARLAEFEIVDGKRVKNADAVDAIKQGFDKGIVSTIGKASKTDKLKMARMVRLLERGRNNPLFGAKNRPSDVIGQSLLDRVTHIRDINRRAGSNLDAVAKSLKGKQADFSGPVDQFLKDLDEMGIDLNEDFTPGFQGADIEGATGAENLIRKIVKRMGSGQPGDIPDAHDMHRLKRFIDEQVTYGKSAEGLTGQAERVVKDLRRNLDSVLDSQFPQYNQVNTTYADTIGALNSLQDVAGRKMNLSGGSADKALGTLLRRILSNAQSRINVVDAVDDIDIVAKKYGGDFQDNISTQVIFANELNRVFPPTNQTTFQGDIAKEVARGIGQSNVERAAEAASKVANKVRGISEESQIRSIRKLLLR